MLDALAIAAAEFLDAHEWARVETRVGEVFRELRERRAHREMAQARDLGGDAPTTLTAHQSRILGLVAEGKTYKEIGAALGRSWRTVNNTVERLRVKFDVASRGELVAEAMRRGMLDAGEPARRSMSA